MDAQQITGTVVSITSRGPKLKGFNLGVDAGDNHYSIKVAWAGYDIGQTITLTRNENGKVRI